MYVCFQNLVRQPLKRPGECHTNEGKRQKETDDHGHHQTVSCNSETGSEKPGSGEKLDQLDLKTNPCAFCQVSKISEVSSRTECLCRFRIPIKHNLFVFLGDLDSC